MFLHERIRLEQMTVLMMTNQFKKPKMHIFIYVLIILINSTLPAVLTECFHKKNECRTFTNFLTKGNKFFHEVLCTCK